MGVRSLLLILLFASSILPFASCGTSGSPASTPLGTEMRPDASGLPQLPTGAADTRQAQLADGVGVAGDPPFDAHNAASEPGGTLLLSVPDPASTDAAWAIYQIPESGGDTVEAFKFDIQYLDPDPLESREHEGYWVAYADYASDCWVINGPYTVTSARANLKPGANVVSPNGFYYAMVLVTGENQARVTGMNYAWYTAPGYEEFWIGRPQGHSPGLYCDLQLDVAGEPHIAYFNSPYALNKHWTTLRVAHRAAGSWEYADLDLGFEPRWSRLAVGYVSTSVQRAVLVGDDNSNDIWLYYDDGGGFDGGQLASNTADISVVGGVTFVNALDDPLGDLDLLVIAYAVPGAPNIQTSYRTYDGAVLSIEQQLHPGTTIKPGRLSLTTTAGKRALAAIPDAPGGIWDCRIGTLSGGVWNFGLAPPWGPLERVETSEEDAPDFVACEVPGSGIVAGYVRQERSEVMLAFCDGLSWQTTASDILPTGFVSLLDLDVFSSGRTVLLDVYGEMKPMLRWGMTGSGEEYGRQYFAAEPYAAVNSSLDVDGANNVHIATYNAKRGEVLYTVRPPSGDPVSELVDNGGLQLGGSAFLAWPVYVENELHVFYLNSTHPGLLHAQNAEGMWLKEGEVITSEGIPYYITGAGYLADLDLLYCGYIDYSTLSYMVASGNPDGSNWQSRPMADTLIEGASIGDNESEVAVVYPAPQPLAKREFRIAFGNPQVGIERTATISLGYRRLTQPLSIAYNPVGEHWGLIANHEGVATAHYYYEDPTGAWLGPYPIATLEGHTAEFRVVHLSYLSSDGAPRIVAGQIADGDTQFRIAVYTAAPGSTSFHALNTMLTVDMLTSELAMASAAARPDGEPVIGVMHKLLVDPNWDFQLFAQDGVDTWGTVDTWDFPVADGGAIVGVNAEGMPCAAAIEMDSLSPNYGQTVVYYPW